MEAKVPVARHSLHMASGRCRLSNLERFRLLLQRLRHFPGMVPLQLAWVWFPTSVKSASLLSLYPKPHKRKELPKSLHLAPLSQFPTAMRSSSAVWLPCIQRDSIANVCILLESGWRPRSAWFQYSLAIFFQVIPGPFQSRVQGLNPGAWDMFRQVGSCNLSFLHHWVRIATLNSLAGAVNRPKQPGVSEGEGDGTYQVKPCSLRDRTSPRSQSLPGSHRWGAALPLANCPQSTLCWWRQGCYLFTLH